MEEIVIRDVKLEDVPSMAVLRQKIWDTTYRGIYKDEVIDNFDYKRAETNFKNYIDQPNTLFKAALCDNKIIGYICFSKIDECYKDYRYIINYFHISKDFQGRGLGTRFFQMIVSYCKQKGIDKFYVTCNKHNLKARKFYEKMGGIIDYIDDNLNNLAKEQVIYIYKVEVDRNDRHYKSEENI